MVPFRFLATLSSMSLAVVVAACAPTAPPAAPAPAAAPTAPPAAAAAQQPAAGQVTSSTYIPVISKGFQHQFWQAVKLGSEQAAKADNVKITFEGPETEAMVDKQIDMLSAALAKKPQALGFAALDSKAAIPLLKKAQAAN